MEEEEQKVRAGSTTARGKGEKVGNTREIGGADYIRAEDEAEMEDG
jgi:hypothetical protein